jgi:flagellar basal body P-ring protein FlgI
MLNRHGLVAGATGTGTGKTKTKTKTLQLIAEQLSAVGVPSSSPTSTATSPHLRPGSPR